MVLKAAQTERVSRTSSARPAHHRLAWGSPLARALVFLLALLPLVRLIGLGVTDNLSANPLEFVTRSTGTWTLILLCINLAITPVRQLTGWHGLMRHRRMLGLFVMFYASLHTLLWFGFDQSWSVSAMLRDVVKRPFITAGFTAFVLLLPLALTSSNRAIRWLGGRNWQRLHRLVYLIALLAILHYWWHKAGKHDFATVSVYAVVVLGLLGWRVWRFVVSSAGSLK